MEHGIIIAGFGGQGIMLIGQLLAYAGMSEGKNVLWLPSYGPESRGGFANCRVIISDEEIGSPVISTPDSLITMNLPSLDRFEASLKENGLLIVNTSLINREVRRKDVRTLLIKANNIAEEIGNPRVANMVILGAFVAQSQILSMESVMESLYKVIPEQRHNMIPINKEALHRGAECVK